MKITIADIDRVYQGLQHLTIQPTKNNTAILTDTYIVLEAAADYIAEREAAGETTEAGEPEAAGETTEAGEPDGAGEPEEAEEEDEVDG